MKCSDCKQDIDEGGVKSPYNATWLCRGCNQKKVKEIEEMNKRNQRHGCLPLSDFIQTSDPAF